MEFEMFRTALFALICAFLIAPVSAHALIAAAPPHAYFVNIKNGDTVTSPFKVEFGVMGVHIAPAGTTKAGTGHFHLLIDTDAAKLEKDMPIPADAQHIHYGKGQTEDTVTLPAGTHTLQIVVADGHHVPMTPPVVSEKITITVK